jgi:hypothetical protein
MPISDASRAQMPISGAEVPISRAEMPVSGEGAASGVAACLRRLAMQPEEQVGLKAGLVDLGLGFVEG